jgi:hypothetical protein
MKKNHVHVFFLGLNEVIGIEFLRSADLIKVGHSWNPAAAVVNKSGWGKFLGEENFIISWKH